MSKDSVSLLNREFFSVVSAEFRKIRLVVHLSVGLHPKTCGTDLKSASGSQLSRCRLRPIHRNLRQRLL